MSLNTRTESTQLCHWHTARINQHAWPMCMHDTLIDCHISFTIMRTGCWECPVLKEVLDILKMHQNATLVDIGANIGYYSLAAAASGVVSRVHAFEASPRNALLLQESVTRNGWADKVTLHAFALGAATGMLRLGTSRRNQGGLHYTEAGGGTQVARIALDDVLPPATRPVFVKMDIEGAECAVVHGMRHFLRASVHIIGFVVEVGQSHTCCNEWCGGGGLFRQLHARSLCPWSRGSNKSPKRSPLSLSMCRNWCTDGGTGDVMWVPCINSKRR